MRRHLRVAFLGLMLLWGGAAWTTPASACPMCKVAHEDSDDPAVLARPRAYMYSILFMLSMPASLFTGFSVAFYRLSRKHSVDPSAFEDSLDESMH
ncbi:hypothetical protein [Planctomicrobium sp. SH664]|uniref:hypothetical protein n=1 Tax=Planctomicrobium sp. SH664 TaxID=3448125 RepID=UPI003F5B2FE1